MRRPHNSELESLYNKTDSGSSERYAERDKTDEKWTPFWQRGHDSEVKHADSVSDGHALRPSSKHVKLFHSTLDISSDNKKKHKRVTISKSVSMQHGLNHMPPIENANSKTRKKRGILRDRNMIGSSSLTLPKIDPDVAVEVERDSRESTATNGVLENGPLSDTNGSNDETDSQASEEVYLSDEDPEVSRQNLEKAGDYIVDHDWILKENLAKEARRMSCVRKQMRILVPDDDPMEAIQSRLDEVTMMVKPKAEWGNFIDTIEPEQRAKIMKYKEIDHEQIRKERRKNWTPLIRFRNAVSTVLLLYRACHPRRRYLADEKADTAPGPVKKIKLNNSNDNKREFTNINLKSSIGFDVQLSLITRPEHRTEHDLKRVTWVLRATKAFKHLFPAQLEDQLARLVFYERYDDKRIVAQQGRDPERFYYIMSGKLHKVREYRLLSGVVTRNEGVVEKGKHTDPEEMTHNWPREHHLVTKGAVEVLILEKPDFLDLQHTCKGPPVDFLQSLDLFKEFPCEEFLNNPDAIDFKYYGQDKMIVKDTNRTPWLHVVKTGKVKVVRSQPIVDVQNETKFVNQSTEELGCARPYSHADAMLGILAKQRKMKSILGTISFPEITSRTKQNITDDPNRQRKKPKPPRAPVVVTPRGSGIFTSFNNNLENIIESSDAGSIGGKKHNLDGCKEMLHDGSAKVSSDPNTGNGNFHLPPIYKDDRRTSSEFVPHGTYLTREKTEFDSVYPGSGNKTKREAVQRSAYLQLDVLKPGDIFGLEHMEPQALASEGPGVTLISDGAEIIKISKRFFVTHAQNNTMLKVETMQREYMTADEAKTVMYDKETWNQYKSVLLQRTVSGLHRNQIDKTL